jgi:hypothetical protein
MRAENRGNVAISERQRVDDARELAFGFGSDRRERFDFFANDVLERNFFALLDGGDHLRARAVFDAFQFADELLLLVQIFDVKTAAVRRTVPISCDTFGSAVSGHAVMHSMHCVQFSAM